MTLEATHLIGGAPAAQRDVLNAAAAVTRALAWGLTPAIENLRRAGLDPEADDLSGHARALTQLADDLAAGHDTHMTDRVASDSHPAFDENPSAVSP